MKPIHSLLLGLTLLLSSLTAQAQMTWRKNGNKLEYSYKGEPFTPMITSVQGLTNVVSSINGQSGAVSLTIPTSATQIGGVLLTTYNANRTTDQAAIAAAQSAANAAQTAANAAQSTASGGVSAFTYNTNRTTDRAATDAAQSTASQAAAGSASHAADKNNPHAVTKAQVGLGNVPNVNATDPVNIVTDATHRFVTDTEKATWNSGTGGGTTSAATVRSYFSSSGDLDYEQSAGKFHLKATQVNTIVASYLKSRDGYQPGRVLAATDDGGFSWVVSTGGSSTTATSPSPGPSPSNVPADSTINRPNYALLTDVPITNVTELATFLTYPQTNKRGKVAKGTYDIGSGTLGQTANWNNVVLTAPEGATITGTNSNLLLFTDTHEVNRVKIDNLTLRSTATGTGYSVILSNELVGFKGLEFSFLTVSGPMTANFNTFNITQYSTSSNQGAVASDLYIHDCQFSAPRIEMEILSQGYDAVRLSNVTITRNKFYKTGANPGEPHRQACSFSGLISGLYMADNTSTGAKDIAWELVNVRYVLAENNSAVTSEVCAGWSITDDGRNSTESIYIRGGSVDVQGRPLVIYDAKGVHVDGVKLKGGRGIDMKARNCTFENLDILIHSTDYDAAWQFDQTSTGNVLKNSTISSWGAAAAGRNPSFETIVLRANTSGNSLINLKLFQGKLADGSYYTDGQPVNQGAASNTVDAATTANVKKEQ